MGGPKTRFKPKCGQYSSHSHVRFLGRQTRRPHMALSATGSLTGLKGHADEMASRSLTEEAVLQIEKSLPPLSNHLSFNLSLLFAVL